MKQGRASRDGPAGRKVEPIPYAVSPAAVSQIGSQMGNHVMDSGRILPGASKPLYQGRGFEAPHNNVKTHKAGSQGGH